MCYLKMNLKYAQVIFLSFLFHKFSCMHFFNNSKTFSPWNFFGSTFSWSILFSVSLLTFFTFLPSLTTRPSSPSSPSTKLTFRFMFSGTRSSPLTFFFLRTCSISSQASSCTARKIKKCLLNSVVDNKTFFLLFLNGFYFW